MKIKINYHFLFILSDRWDSSIVYLLQLPVPLGFLLLYCISYPKAQLLAILNFRYAAADNWGNSLFVILSSTGQLQLSPSEKIK